MKRALSIMLLAVGVCSAAAGDKYYVQLIKATNNGEPPKKGAKAIGPNLGDKLSPVFCWKYYWETERHETVIDNEELKRLQLSANRSVELAPKPNGKIEVRLYRGKEFTRKSCHRVHDQMMAILGFDDDKGKEAWFVVVRREEPQYEVAKQ